MAVICASFQNKYKYDAGGKMKGRDRFLTKCVATSLSGMWTLVHTITLFFYVVVGSKSFEEAISKITAWEWNEHWLPLILVLICMYIYATRKLLQFDDASATRVSILFFINKYHSPEISLEKVANFCKVNQLKLFPIVQFRYNLAKVGKEEEDKNGKVFNSMVADMNELRRLEALKKPYVSERNFNALLSEGAFSKFL